MADPKEHSGGAGRREPDAHPAPGVVTSGSSTPSILGGSAKTVALLLSIINNAPIPIFMKDLEGRYFYANRAYEEATGFPREKTLGSTDFDLYPRSKATAFRDSDTRAMQTAAPVRHQPFAREDERAFTTLKFRIFDEHGEILGVCGISLDVTDSLRSEQAGSDERHRLAAELHDDAVQVMATVAMSLENLEREAAGQAKGRLADLRGMVIDALQRLRTFMSDMQVADATELNLRASLTKILETIEREHSITFTLEDSVASVPRSIAVGLDHIAREALINVTKHAQASHVDVSLSERDEGIHMMVADDGVGFEVTGARSAEHMGLSSMRSRARSMGGQVQINSHKGGTRVEAWVPDRRQDGISSEAD
jgi:PAS domain S-box-containing protein